MSEQPKNLPNGFLNGLPIKWIDTDESVGNSFWQPLEVQSSEYQGHYAKMVEGVAKSLGVPKHLLEPQPTPDLTNLHRANAEMRAQGREVHSDVVMTEGMLERLMRARGCPELATKNASVGRVGYVLGMDLHLRKTFMGAAFAAMLLAGIDGKKVLLVREDCSTSTVEWH